MTTTVFGTTVRPASGALLVTPRGNELIVENHLGLELRDVVVWKAGQAYHVDALAIGAQAAATALSAAEAAARIPVPNEILPERLRMSYASLAASDRDRYVARGLPTVGFPRLLARGYTPLIGATAGDRPVAEDRWLLVGLL
jgi:hypothetical protein